MKQLGDKAVAYVDSFWRVQRHCGYYIAMFCVTNSYIQAQCGVKYNQPAVPLWLW